MRGDNEETLNDEKFNEYMDAYAEKENEILEERAKLFEEYNTIMDLNGRDEFIVTDMNRYKMHYMGWSIASVILLLLSTKLFK